MIFHAFWKRQASYSAAEMEDLTGKCKQIFRPGVSAGATEYSALETALLLPARTFYRPSSGRPESVGASGRDGWDSAAQLRTRRPQLLFRPVEEPGPLHFKNSAPRHPSLTARRHFA